MIAPASQSQVAFSRPRLSPWAELRPQEGIIVDQRKGIAHRINATTAAVVNLCDGEVSLQQILTALAAHFPAADDVENEVLGLLEQLQKQELVVYDGGLAALEYRGDIVRRFDANTTMIESLEHVRTQVFQTLNIETAGSFTDDLEPHLDHAALQQAKNDDRDAAPMNDTRVLPYQGLLESRELTDSVDAIAREIKALLPELESEIEISGNALYLRGAYMGWHSNHSRSDGRVYCSWAERDDSNFFRYEHPITGEIMTDWEQAGWNIKSFTIPPKHSRFWHCIGAGSLRFSLGFRYQLPVTA